VSHLALKGTKYVPFPKQVEFHQACENPKYRYVCYWGALDSGKTWAGAAQTAKICYEHPGTTFVVSRFTYRELHDSTAKQLREDFLIPMQLEKKYVRRDEKIIVHAKGGGTSEIYLRSLDRPEKFRSMQVDGIWLDEGSDPKIGEPAFNLLRGRMRDSENPTFIITCNPPFIDHFVHKYFQNPGGAFYTVFTTTFDNPYHDKEYVADLMASYPPDWIEVYLMGRAGAIIAGRPVYKGAFDRAKNCIPFEWSPALPLYVSWDFGVKRSAVLWATIATLKSARDAFIRTAAEHLIFLEEAVFEGLPADEIAKRVRARTLRKFGMEASKAQHAADIAGNQRSQATNTSPIMELRRQGINPRVTRIPDKEEFILDMSKNMRMMSYGVPLILVTPACEALATGLDRGYHRNETGEIVADGFYIHLADAAMYLNANFFSAPAMKVRRPRNPITRKAVIGVEDYGRPLRRQTTGARYKFR
jgi:hypothetical protein